MSEFTVCRVFTTRPVSTDNVQIGDRLIIDGKAYTFMGEEGFVLDYAPKPKRK